MQDLVSQRRRQGWRVAIPTSATGVRVQLIEVHADEPSVCTITYDKAGTPLIDDAGIVTVQTRVDEATRERSFPSRWQGHALSVPAGVTRVFVEGFQKSFAVNVQVAPGVAVYEHTPGLIGYAPAGTGQSYEAPSYARAVRVTALASSILVFTGPLPFSWVQNAGTPSESVIVPAYGSIRVQDNGGGGGSTYSLQWEVTA